MKKIILLLFIVVCFFTACSKDKVVRESKKNQEGFVQGDNTVKNLTFSFPKGYAEEDGVYFYRDNDNTIFVDVQVVENTDRNIEKFIQDDSISFSPIMDSFEKTKIHGNVWYKGKSSNNDTLYYILDGTDIYYVMLSPVMAKVQTFNELMETFEDSLYFK